MVEVTVGGEPRYGVIRWIGIVPEDKKARKVAGIEMVGSELFSSNTCVNLRSWGSSVNMLCDY